MFLRRRLGGALAWGLLVLGTLGASAWLLYPPRKEAVVEVELQPEIEDFAVEEEPEPEQEPPPPPPPNTKVEVVDAPKPVRKPKPPKKKVTEAVEESDAEKTVQVGPGGGTPGGMGTNPAAGTPKAIAPKPKPKPAPVEPKPKPKPKATKPPLDPTKPIDRPENATAPKPKASNAQPEYPKELRDKGITGKVVIKLHVHRDGSVRGAKILRKSNNATTEEDQARANKLLLAAVVKAVKGWTFEPAKLGNQTITVWHTVTIPFTLTTG